MQRTKNLPLSPNSIALQSIPPTSPSKPCLSYSYRQVGGSSSSSCEDSESSSSSPTHAAIKEQQNMSCLTHSHMQQLHVSHSLVSSSHPSHAHHTVAIAAAVSSCASTAAPHPHSHPHSAANSTSNRTIIAYESVTAAFHTHTTLHPHPSASPSVPHPSVSLMSPPENSTSSMHRLRRSGPGGFYEVGDPMSASTSEHSLSQLLHEADYHHQHPSEMKTTIESHHHDSIPPSLPTKPTRAGRSEFRGNHSASPVTAEPSPAQKAQDRLNLVGTLACALEQLCPTSVPLPTDPMFLSLFHTSALPSISVGDYLSRLTSYTSVSEECLIQACIHIFTLATNGKREEHRRRLEQAIRAQKKRKLAAISKRMVSSSSVTLEDEDDGGDEDDSHLSYDSSDSFEPDIMSPDSFSSSDSSASDESATPSIDAHHSTRPTHPRINSFSNQPFLVSAHNIHRLLLTSILATSKFVDDAFYNNNIFSTLGGVSLKELNRLELEFLRLIDYRLFLSPEVFLEYYQQVFNHQSKHGHWCLKPHHALGPDYQLLREENDSSSSCSETEDSSEQGEEYEHDLDESGLRAEGEEVDDQHVDEEINMAGVNLAGASSATPYNAVGVAPYNSPPNAASLSTTPVYQAVAMVSPNSPGPEEERPSHEPIHLMDSGDAHEFHPSVHHHDANSIHEHKDTAPSFFSPSNNKRHHSTHQAHSFHTLHQTYEQLIASAESDDGVMRDVSSASPPQRHAKRPNTSVSHPAHTQAN